MEASVRAQDRIAADKMLQEDLRRAREIRRSALAAVGASVAQLPISPPSAAPTTTAEAAWGGSSLSSRWSPSRRNVPGRTGSSPSRQPTSPFRSGSPSKMPVGSGMASSVIATSIMDDNKSLREKLYVKTSELQQLRREVDRLMEELREKSRANAILETRAQQHERDYKQQELMLTESQAHAAKLHDMADRVREEDDLLRNENQLLEERMSQMHDNIARCEAAIDSSRLQQQQTVEDCEFRLNIMEESKTEIEHELESSKEELKAMALELKSFEEKIIEKEEEIEQSKFGMIRLEEENSRVALKAQEWHSEAERLHRLLDEKNRLHFEVKGEGDIQLKQLKLELHETQAQLARVEVDKNVLAASKLDLTHEVNRLNRRADEREQQVKRLLRLIEEKDQTIAEMGPAMREAKRASSQSRVIKLRKNQKSGWKS